MHSKRLHRNHRKPRSAPVVPGWVWSGLIMGALLVVLFVINTLAFGAATITGGTALVCYPVQLLAYLFNGLLSCQLDSGRQKILRQLNPRRPAPNYMIIGALGGLVLSLIAAGAYVLTSRAAVALAPPVGAIFGSSLILMIAIDAVAAIGLGLLGGLIYNQYFR